MTDATPSSLYRDLLEVALVLGRTDGLMAADFEPTGTVDPLGFTCRGRDPEQFARLLWGSRPGRPPSGLELNAPRFYLSGFSQALAERLATGVPSPVPTPRSPAQLPVRRHPR